MNAITGARFGCRLSFAGVIDRPPKSDISDLGPFLMRNSGKPELRAEPYRAGDCLSV
jgi:hypothetical protein